MEIIHLALSPKNFPDEFLKFSMVQLNVVTVFLVAFTTWNLHLYHSFIRSKFFWSLNFLVSGIEIVREEKRGESKDHETYRSTEEGHLYYSYDLNFLIIEFPLFWNRNGTKRNE